MRRKWIVVLWALTACGSCGAQGRARPDARANRSADRNGTLTATQALTMSGVTTDTWFGLTDEGGRSRSSSRHVDGGAVGSGAVLLQGGPRAGLRSVYTLP